MAVFDYITTTTINYLLANVIINSASHQQI